ncbi:flotillin-like protein FloA [Candidatus Poribacteria bacterium]|nr:flotillin-like protein FloA [Candidatus Poribacteria bacterium]MDE0400824.1 flotillin-like protein FloA [Candidatus Poribacteria bacterium]MYH83678.1 flotillin-like protein FloA [Candidatus Poribacteria bacterium]MYK95528.1 flotillin-like protein FloA [Candidatus Poribacteria bacterium]
MTPTIVAIIAVLILLFLIIISWLVPVGLWITAIAAGVKVGIFDLVAMRLRRVPPAAIVEPQINATKAGLTLSLDDLEAHFLAGGRVASVVAALIAADKANIDLGFAQAAAIDLAGRDVLQAVQVSVTPEIIDIPSTDDASSGITAVARDGIQLIVKARVTVRADIDRLVGGATEDTIRARVGEGIITTIGSSGSHKEVLENPVRISETVLDKGLAAGTAFEILSIDIADINVGENVGAKLQTDQAEAELKIARAKAEEQRARAQAEEEENKALVEEMTIKLVEADAEVPLAIADTLNTERMSVMDYYELRNILADTEMRQSIASPITDGQEIDTTRSSHSLGLS